MKNIAILLVATLFNINSYAQRIESVTAGKAHIAGPSIAASTSGRAGAKTTALGDTVTLYNVQATDSLVAYKVGSADSGYMVGPNYWGDKAFAERYVNDSSSNMQVIGLYALFTGKVNSASTLSIKFKVWDQGAQQMIADTLAYNGFPNNVLDSISVPVTQLGIGIPGGPGDTIKNYFFPVATGNVTSFFVGYSIDYNFSTLAGDTIGLVSSADGQRTGAKYTYKITISDFGDTTVTKVLNVQNATLGSDNVWYDNYTQNDSLLNNLAIYPIVILGFPTNIKGITKNELTFYGSYPNPAANSANVKFSLASAADVTIQLMDMSGRLMNTIQQAGLSVGEHIIPVSLSGLPSGEYIYLIRTSAGDGFGGKIIHQ